MGKGKAALRECDGDSWPLSVSDSGRVESGKVEERKRPEEGVRPVGGVSLRRPPVRERSRKRKVAHREATTAQKTKRQAGGKG